MGGKKPGLAGAFVKKNLEDSMEHKQNITVLLGAAKKAGLQ